MTELNEELLAAAVLGKEVESFYSSDVGQYLLARAERELAEASLALQTVDPADTTRIAILQAKCWRANSFRGWLEAAIIAGLKAHEILEERDDG